MIGNARDIIMSLMNVQDDLETRYEIKEWHKHRSLNQNSYYWKLATELARKLKKPISEVHNRNLEDYGQLEYIGGRTVLTPLPDTDEVFDRVYRLSTVHLKHGDEVKQGKDGIMYRTYILMRGSHTYNTQEMTQLLDGCIQEAQNVGIETATPAELEQMRRDAEEAEARKEARKKR